MFLWIVSLSVFCGSVYLLYSRIKAYKKRRKGNDFFQDGVKRIAGYSIPVIGIVLGALLIGLSIDSSVESKKKERENPVTEQVQKYEVEVKRPAYSEKYKSEEDREKELQAKAIQDTIEKVKADGQLLIFTEGYTFEKCAEAAEKYMKDEFGEEFYTTSVFASTPDLKTYDFTGYTKSGKKFWLLIFHEDEIKKTWVVIDDYCE